jgi:hypothetical protein
MSSLHALCHIHYGVALSTQLDGISVTDAVALGSDLVAFGKLALDIVEALLDLAEGRHVDFKRC